MEVQTSLLVLNNDCLREIFEFLDVKECINLAETCHRLQIVADEAYKQKFSKFTIDKEMINSENMTHILSQIGRHVSSLKIDYAWQKNECKILRKIQEHCKSLISLTFVHCELSDEQKLDSIIYVKMLTLSKCALEVKKGILKNFYGLRFLHIYHCSNIKAWALQKCMERNPNINNIALIGYGFDVLKTIEPLTQLNYLTKLKLTCHMENLNNFLFQLASRGIMEELELFRIKIDDYTFRILNLFDKLQLLVLDQCLDFTELNTSLPLNMKHLQFRGFNVSVNTVISIIKQLKLLENIDLFCCRCIPPEPESISFHDIQDVFQEISKAMHFQSNQPLLTVTLPAPCARLDALPVKYICESYYLRICNNCFVEKCFDTYHPERVFGNFPSLDYRYF